MEQTFLTWLYCTLMEFVNSLSLYLDSSFSIQYSSINQRLNGSDSEQVEEWKYNSTKFRSQLFIYRKVQSTNRNLPRHKMRGNMS